MISLNYFLQLVLLKMIIVIKTKIMMVQCFASSCDAIPCNETLAQKPTCMHDKVLISLLGLMLLALELLIGIILNLIVVPRIDVLECSIEAIPVRKVKNVLRYLYKMRWQLQQNKRN